MKTTDRINHGLIVTAMLLIAVYCNAQFYPTGGYQEGLYGNGGDDTFEFFNTPGNLIAIGGDDEVFLAWDAPFPIGEVKYDDASAEMWYWLNSPSSGNDYFYVRFNPPFDGFLTDIAVLNSASSPVTWQDIRVCPDDGSGKPNLAGAWQIFSSITVSSIPQAGGEWEVLSLSVPQPVSAGTTFFIVTRWTSGSVTGPFVATDTGTNSGRSAWSVDGGTTWNTWTENFIMRAFVTTEPAAGVQIIPSPEIPSGALPVMALATGEISFPKSNKIAASLKYSPLINQGKSIIGLSEYKIYRSEIASGPYTIIDSVPATSYTDQNAENNTEYFYVVTAQYQKGESEYSNEAAVLPQAAATLAYQNTFDTDNGGFYPKGEWEWGVPAYAGGPPAAYSTPNLWGTNLDGTYGNFTNSWLLQPFDVHFSSTCRVSFATWFQTQSGKDYGYFAVDHDYDNVYDVLDSYSGSSSGWQMKEIIIPDSLKSDYVRFAFILLSDHVTTYAGFYIDDLTVESYAEISLKTFIEGPFVESEMTTALNSAGILPFDQPFNSNPSALWYYTGSENVSSIPNVNVTDWILVELRQTAGNASTATSDAMIARQAGFILKNGNIVALNGSSNLKIPAGVNQNLYIVVWHRNHLGIMSSSPPIKTSEVYSWDFTTGYEKAFGGATAHKELAPEIWGMISGDGDGNGLIETLDKNTIWTSQSGQFGYNEGDFTLDGQVNNSDKNQSWLLNLGSVTSIPY